MKDFQKNLYLLGSFTIEPILSVLAFWSRRLDWSGRILSGPYAQVYQQLLNPSSDLRANQPSISVLCIRWIDLIDRSALGDANAEAKACRAAAEELARALQHAQLQASTFIVICPDNRLGQSGTKASEFLSLLTAALPQTFVLRGEEAIARYSVGQVFDPIAENAGHVPYTQEATAALGSMIARACAAVTRKPLKVIAVDCDNTLWGGVVGEDGPSGLAIDAAHRRLHRALVDQSQAGRMVCLLSKNEAADVNAVFAQRSDLDLKTEHVLARRINWDSKAHNLRALADEFDLGLDSFLFLDDNPLECAEMRTCCPSVTTVRIPSDSAGRERFVDHLWPLDLLKVTAEDRKRLEMYRDSAARGEMRRSAASMADFLAGLKLEVNIASPTPDETPRLAQLTQRTNQFNASLKRCSEVEFLRDLETPVVHLRRVRVTDRFGDYGLVGEMRATEQANSLKVDLFLLSCRALGRGVEHLMLSHLGKLAMERGLEWVEIVYRPGERNRPVRHFLRNVLDNGFDFNATGEIGALAQIVAQSSFNPTAQPASEDTDEDDQFQVTGISPIDLDRGASYEDIAISLNNAEAIVAAMTTRTSVRPKLAVGYVEPASGLEKDIAAIWSEVLRITGIGARDSFKDLGGKSIDLVRILVLLKNRLGVEIELPELFEHSTVTLLAKRLENGEQSSVALEIRDRAAKMRNARGRSTMRAANAESREPI